MSRLGSAWRLSRAAFVLARRDALLPREYHQRLPLFARLFSKFTRLFAKPERADNPGERFAQALEALGPSYVKLGQFLSTRADILDPRFARGLARLKDSVPPFPHAKAVESIEAEFGAPLKSLFAELGQSVAAASVAQVHPGRDNGGGVRGGEGPPLLLLHGYPIIGDSKYRILDKRKISKNSFMLHSYKINFSIIQAY